MLKDTINRKPSDKKKIEALNEYSGKRKYEFWGGCLGTRSREGWGENLWSAIMEDTTHPSSQYWSVFDEWANDRAEELTQDKELQQEYRPTDLWSISIIIGTNERRIHIKDVNAKSRGVAITQCRKEIKSEFPDVNYRITAKLNKPDDLMSEEKFNEMCHNDACEETNDIENWIDVKSDKEVAEFFGFTYQIIEWECDNCDIINLDDVKAICECGYPLCADDLVYDNENDDFPECAYCGKDLRTVDEVVLDAI